jgi:hypothetical protein
MKRILNAIATLEKTKSLQNNYIDTSQKKAKWNLLTKARLQIAFGEKHRGIATPKFNRSSVVLER